MKTSTMDELRACVDAPGFSGVVSVIRRGQVLCKEARGFANRESGERNSMGTRFATASLSKMFTAVCIARLVDAGLCKFDTPLAAVVPFLQPEWGEEITIASLLSHRSGLGDYIDDNAVMPFDGMDTSKLERPLDFMPYLLARMGKYEPGSFRYSSAGYILLGLAIESLTALPFTEAMRRWVIGPAGMMDTGFPPLDAPAAGMATGYLGRGEPNFRHLPRIGGPDGGIVTNVADLLWFFACLRGEDLVSSASRTFLFQEQSWFEPSGAYAHGFMADTIGTRKWYGHTGSDPGVSARVAFSPEEESSIIVLCNADDVAFHAFKLARQRLDA